MDNSSKSHLVLAGLLTTGMSSAAVCYWYCKRKPDRCFEKTSADTNGESASTSASTSSGVNVTGADKTTFVQDNVSKQNGGGVTIVLSSSIIKAFVLARKIKSAGLNIISWDRLDETDKNSNQTFDGSGSFLYGRHRYRSAQDLYTGRTFLLQKCASDLAVRPDNGESVTSGGPSADSVPPVSEIFPMSVLKRAGVCHDPFFRDDDDSEDDSSSGFITRKSSGKVVRVIKSSKHLREYQRTDQNAIPLDDLTNTSVVQTYQASNCPSGLARVGRTGLDFGDMYNSVYNDHHVVDTPVPPVVLYNCHSQ